MSHCGLRAVALLLAGVVVVLSGTSGLHGQTLYVDDDNTSGAEDGTPAHPYNTVQEGINAAGGGYTVVVLPGVYVESINFNGKAITVRSTDPDSASVVAATIVDGNQAGSVVTFNHGEGPGSVLEGLTVRNGLADYGGGIGCSSSSPTVRRNVIRDNGAQYYGGGVYISGGSPTFLRNTIKDNTAATSGWGHGGGVYCWSNASPVIRNNVICGNTVVFSWALGGGIYLEYQGATAVFEGNSVIQNSAGSGVGDGVFCGSALTIKNCIIRDNSAEDGREIIGYMDWGGPVTVTYCNVKGGQAAVSESINWGPGNIDVDPQFADPAGGDYHLKSQAGRWDPEANGGAGGWVLDGVTSPCVDAGDPASAYGDEPSPNGSRINMGAYGNTVRASKSVPAPQIASSMPPSGPITTYMKIGGSWFGVAEGKVEMSGAEAEILSWTDTEIHCRVQPGTTSGPLFVRRLNGVQSNMATFDVTAPDTVYADDDNTSGVENGTPTWPFSRIQRGVDAAVEIATIQAVEVARGLYVENVNFRGEAVIVRSTDPDDAAVVADTIIDGNQQGSTVTFNSGEGPDSVLTGFTLRGGGGTDHYGGGIHCDGTSPLIEKNRIVGNTVHFHGGGIYSKGGAPTIRNNVIAANTARWFGGGVTCFDSTAVITRNIIHGNAAHWYGGGVFAHGPAAPTLMNNVIYDNTGSEGGGIAFIYQCSPTVENNTVSANSAERSGGGIYAGWDCSPVLRNMIVWGNVAPDGPQLALAESSSVEVTYSDIQAGETLIPLGEGCGMTWGDGNIDLPPLFASLTDFHLKSTGGRYDPASGLPPGNPSAWVVDAEHSPAIDTGDPVSPYLEELAPNGSRINMGAYGNTEYASKSGVAGPLAAGLPRPMGQDAPHLVATMPVLGSKTFPLKTLTLTFDHAVRVGADAVEVHGIQTGAHPGYKLTYDPDARTLHVEWPSPLPPDTYEVRVIADFILSAEGDACLDGEVSDPASPASLPSGDGIPGGDAHLRFEVE